MLQGQKLHLTPEKVAKEWYEQTTNCVYSVQLHTFEMKWLFQQSAYYLQWN